MDSFGTNESKVWRPKAGKKVENTSDIKKNANPLKGAVNFVAGEAKDIGRRVGEFTGIGKGHETKVGGDVSIYDKNKTIKAGSGGKEKNTNYYDRSDISTEDKIKHGAKDAVKSSFELAGATEAARGAASVGKSLKNAGKGTGEAAGGATAGKVAEKVAGKEVGKQVGKRGGSILGHEFQARSKYMSSPGPYSNETGINQKDTSEKPIASNFDADDASSSHAEDVVNQAIGSTNEAKAPKGDTATVKTAKTSTPEPSPDAPKQTGNQFLDAYNNYQKKSMENWNDPELF